VSRVGKKPITLPKGVAVTCGDSTVHVKGPKGELDRKLPPLVGLEIGDQEVQVKCDKEGRQSRAMQGLCRALVQNMVTGVSAGFRRVLEINGVGYRAEARGGVLSLALGYSHPIEVMLPEGVGAQVEKNQVILSGIDRERIGQVAAVLRGQRPPEPYKGKGIRYVEETIRRKVGKAGAS